MQPLRDSRSLPKLLTADLRQRILAGEWAPGAQLPSEQSLAESLGVSRPTVRTALRNLAAGGLVHIRQGSGTFVTARGPGIVTGLQELRSTSELIAAQLDNSEVNYRYRKRRMATPEEAAYFDADIPLQVIVIERSFVSGEEVIAFEWALLNASLLPADLDPDKISGSIFAFLKPLGLIPDQAIATVHACNDESIAWPGTSSPSSLYLCLTQQGYMNDGRVITWSKTYFTEGKFEFLLVRSR